MIYLCLLPLYQFIATVEKPEYSRLSHHVSFIYVAGVRALCMSLNLIKYASHLKKKQKKKLLISLQSSLKHVCSTCWLYYVLLITLVNSATLTLLRNYPVSVYKRTLTARFLPKAWLPYNRPDLTKQCTGNPGDFMKTVKKNLGTIMIDRPQIFLYCFHKIPLIASALL